MSETVLSERTNKYLKVMPSLVRSLSVMSWMSIFGVYWDSLVVGFESLVT
jgi:hypothetical protein